MENIASEQNGLRVASLNKDPAKLRLCRSIVVG